MTLVRQSVLLLACLFSLPMAAQQASLNDFQSRDDDTRIAAFYALLHPIDGEAFNAADLTSRLLRDRPEERTAVVASLISLLERENVRVRRPFDERFSNYYGDLIWSVASLRDAGAVQALLGAVETGGLATNGLASLGQAALPATLQALNTTDRGVRNGVLRVLAKMAVPRPQSPLDAESTARIRESLLKGIGDDDPFNRAVSIRGLIHFDDAEVRGAILRTTDDASDRVREVAHEWLREHPLP
jgi:HEAT repeat protein